MDTSTSEWKIIPKQDSENENVIFFAISDDYSFAAANIMMSLNKYSEALMKTTDIIIYHDGISRKNAELLQSLHTNTYFVSMCFPPEWMTLLEDPRTTTWGSFVICKFFGFELIKKYKNVLHLDADMHILGDISPLFQIEEELAWRTIVGWDINTNFAPLLPTGGQVHCGNGGLLLFTDKLLKYHITPETIQTVFEEVKDLAKGGTDEIVLAWLVFKNGIVLKELDISVYNTTPFYMNPEARLVHFIRNNAVPTKPWENLASYLYYDEWAQNHRAWLAMGGDRPVSFPKEAYYRLFGYDKAAQIRKLKKSVKNLRKSNEEYAAELAVAREEIAALNDKAKAMDRRIAELEEKLCVIRSSKSWRLTAPLRKLLTFVKRFCAKA